MVCEAIRGVLGVRGMLASDGDDSCLWPTEESCLVKVLRFMTMISGCSCSRNCLGAGIALGIRV